jgi:hypothetical protein
MNNHYNWCNKYQFRFWRFSLLLGVMVLDKFLKPSTCGKTFYNVDLIITWHKKKNYFLHKTFDLILLLHIYFSEFIFIHAQTLDIISIESDRKSCFYRKHAFFSIRVSALILTILFGECKLKRYKLTIK